MGNRVKGPHGGVRSFTCKSGRGWQRVHWGHDAAHIRGRVCCCTLHSTTGTSAGAAAAAGAAGSPGLCTVLAPLFDTPGTVLVVPPYMHTHIPLGAVPPVADIHSLMCCAFKR